MLAEKVLSAHGPKEQYLATARKITKATMARALSSQPPYVHAPQRYVPSHAAQSTFAAVVGEYPKKQISKEVTTYNTIQVFYPESRPLLRRYSRDKAPSCALRLPTVVA